MKTKQQITNKARTLINKMMELHEDALGNPKTKDAYYRYIGSDCSKQIRIIEEFMSALNQK
jgi:hypothetical protein